ncbi:hypothetical protein BDW74DRAFT_142862 [Aspergillus multicolor]|uniref:uncharacterized protein n=1 Tax=Aspergillus multicolor TaxID=41759 RepID=UPI003CCD61CF
MELTGIEEENDDWYGDLRSDGSQDDQAADANSAMGDSDHGSEAESGAHLHNQAQEAHASGTALSPPAEGQFLGNQLAQAIQQMTRILMGVAPVNRVAGITEEHTASRTNDPTGTIEQLYQRVDGLETLLLSKMDKLTTVTDQLRRRVDTVELLYNETITEQQNNEEKLKDNEKKLDTVVEDAAKDRTAIKEVVQPLLALATFLKENNDSSTCGDS